MKRVAVGQVWSVLNRSRVRVEFQVDSIVNDGNETRAHGHYVGTSKTVSFTVTALGHGRRGSRLVRDVNGHEPYKGPRVKGHKTVENTATASDYIKVKSPRGCIAIQPRMQEAFKMDEDGVDRGQIAAHYGVSRQLVSAWISKVAAKRLEERHMQALRRS